MIYYIILCIMTIIGAIASFFLKKASGFKMIEALKNKNLYIGSMLYGVSAIMNIWILRYIDYSVVLPLTSITYVWTIILSARYLHEIVTKRKILGVSFIVIGAILISMN